MRSNLECQSLSLGIKFHEFSAVVTFTIEAEVGTSSDALFFHFEEPFVPLSLRCVQGELETEAILREDGHVPADADVPLSPVVPANRIVLKHLMGGPVTLTAVCCTELSVSGDGEFETFSVCVPAMNMHGTPAYHAEWASEHCMTVVGRTTSMGTTESSLFTGWKGEAITCVENRKDEGGLLCTVERFSSEVTDSAVLCASYRGRPRVRWPRTMEHEFVFVLDCGGGSPMAGVSFTQAREALLLAVQSLPLGCLFNIVTFGRLKSIDLFEVSRRYTQERLEQARTYLDGLTTGGGGKRLDSALEAVMRSSRVLTSVPEMITDLMDESSIRARDLVATIKRIVTMIPHPYHRDLREDIQNVLEAVKTSRGTEVPRSQLEALRERLEELRGPVVPPQPDVWSPDFHGQFPSRAFRDEVLTLLCLCRRPGAVVGSLNADVLYLVFGLLAQKSKERAALHLLVVRDASPLQSADKCLLLMKNVNTKHRHVTCSSLVCAWTSASTFPPGLEALSAASGGVGVICRTAERLAPRMMELLEAMEWRPRPHAKLTLSTEPAGPHTVSVTSSMCAAERLTARTLVPWESLGKLYVACTGAESLEPVYANTLTASERQAEHAAFAKRFSADASHEALAASGWICGVSVGRLRLAFPTCTAHAPPSAAAAWEALSAQEARLAPCQTVTVDGEMYGVYPAQQRTPDGGTREILAGATPSHLCLVDAGDHEDARLLPLASVEYWVDSPHTLDIHLRSEEGACVAIRTPYAPLLSKSLYTYTRFKEGLTTREFACQSPLSFCARRTVAYNTPPPRSSKFQRGRGATLALTIQDCDTDTTRSMRFHAAMLVWEATQQIREKFSYEGRSWNHALYASAHGWLALDRPLFYYDLQDGDQVRMRRKRGPLKIRLPDGATCTMLADWTESVDVFVARIHERIGLSVELDSCALKLDGEWLAQSACLSSVLPENFQGSVDLALRFVTRDTNVVEHDPCAMALVFGQLVDTMESGGGPACDAPLLPRLAALAAQATGGDYSADATYRFVDTKQGRAEASAEHRRLVGLRPQHATLRFIQTCKESAFYGVTVFEVTYAHPKNKKKKGKPGRIAFSKDKITLWDTRQHMVWEHSLKHLRRWAANKRSFCMDFGDRHEEYVTVLSDHASAMSQVVSAHVDVLIRPCRRDLGSVEPCSDLSGTSPYGEQGVPRLRAPHKYQALIRDQLYDGSWRMDDVRDLLPVDTHCPPPGVDVDVWTTAIVLAFLHEGYPAFASETVLLVRKAGEWLNGRADCAADVLERAAGVVGMAVAGWAEVVDM